MFELNNCIFWFLIPIDISIIASSPRIMAQLRYFFQGDNKSHSSVSFSQSQITDKDVLVFSVYNTATEEQDFTNFKNAQPHFPLYTPLRQFNFLDLSRKRPTPLPPTRIFRKQLHDYGFRLHGNGALLLNKAKTVKVDVVLKTGPLSTTQTNSDQQQAPLVNPVEVSNDNVNKPNTAKRPSIWFEQYPVCSVPMTTAMNQTDEQSGRSKLPNGRAAADDREDDEFVTRPLNVLDIGDDDDASAPRQGQLGDKNKTSSPHKSRPQPNPDDVVSNDLDFDTNQLDEPSRNDLTNNKDDVIDGKHRHTLNRSSDTTDPSTSRHQNPHQIDPDSTTIDDHKTYWSKKRHQLSKLKHRLVTSISTYYANNPHTLSHHGKKLHRDKDLIAVIQEKHFPTLPDPYFLTLEDLYACITSQRLASYLQYINTRDQDQDDDSAPENSKIKQENIDRLKDLGLFEDTDVIFGIKNATVRGIGRSTTFTASMPHKFTHFAGLGPMLGYCSDPLYSYKALSLLESDRVTSVQESSQSRSLHTNNAAERSRKKRTKQAQARARAHRRYNPQPSTTRSNLSTSKRGTHKRTQIHTHAQTKPITNQLDVTPSINLNLPNHLSVEDVELNDPFTISPNRTEDQGLVVSQHNKPKQTDSGGHIAFPQTPPHHRRVQSSAGSVSFYGNTPSLELLELDNNNNNTTTVDVKARKQKPTRNSTKKQPAAADATFLLDTTTLSSIHQTFSNSQYHPSLIPTQSFSGSFTGAYSTQTTSSPPSSFAFQGNTIAAGRNTNTIPAGQNQAKNSQQQTQQQPSPSINPQPSNITSNASKSQSQTKLTTPTTATTTTTTTSHPFKPTANPLSSHTSPHSSPHSPPQLSISLDETLNELQSRLQLEHSTIRQHGKIHANDDSEAALHEEERQKRDRRLEQQERDEISRLYSYNHSISSGNLDEYSIQYSTTLSSGYDSTLASYNMHTYFEKKKKAANVKSFQHPDINVNVNGTGGRVKTGGGYNNNNHHHQHHHRNNTTATTRFNHFQDNSDPNVKKNMQFSTIFAQNTHRDQNTYYLLSPLTISQTNAIFHPYTIFHKCKSQLELNQLAFQLLLNPFQQRLICLNTHWGYFMYPSTTPNTDSRGTTPTNTPTASSSLTFQQPPPPPNAPTRPAGPATGTTNQGSGLTIIPAAAAAPVPANPPAPPAPPTILNPLTNHHPTNIVGQGFRDRLIDLQHTQHLLSSLRIVAYDITIEDEFNSMIRYIKSTYTQSVIKDVATITTPLQTTFTLFLAYNNHIMDDCVVNERRNQIKYELNKIYMAFLLQNPYCTEPVFISMPVDVQQQTLLFTSLVTKYIIDISLLRMKLQVEQ